VGDSCHPVSIVFTQSGFVGFDTIHDQLSFSV
jgi:hypothetical protein